MSTRNYEVFPLCRYAAANLRLIVDCRYVVAKLQSISPFRFVVNSGLSLCRRKLRSILPIRFVVMPLRNNDRQRVVVMSTRNYEVFRLFALSLCRCEITIISGLSLCQLAITADRFEMSDLRSLDEKSPRKKHALNSTVLHPIKISNWYWLYVSIATTQNSSNTTENKIE